MAVATLRRERIDLPIDRVPERWYNVIPDLPRLPDDYLDSATQEAAGDAYMERLVATPLVRQDASLERWVPIPPDVLQAYRMWRPTPLFRAHELEKHLDTTARIYFKYEGGSPTGSFKLNTALAQAYYTKLEGHRRMVTDTGAGQWGSAIALAGALLDLEVLVFMVRASFHHKPYRRHLMETYGATVHPSPSSETDFGRRTLAERPDHPGSEATAVSEALEIVRGDESSRFALGAFSNYVLLHQTVIGLETREQLDLAGEDPDYLVGSVGCGSNFGGFTLPWVADKLDGREVELVAAEPEACPTLTQGEYRYDFSDACGTGPSVRTYTLGHDFVPPPIHAGGLRYHGSAPIVGLMHNEGLVNAVAYPQTEVFEAGRMFARLEGFVPAPETAHAIRAVVDIAQRARKDATICFCFSGHGLLDLGAYGEFAAGRLDDVAPYRPGQNGTGS
ncbi:MAG TPA: TrpB-like pyridoxal phosphate-dependent enzyme [Thermoleophilaceae bacterium]|jgi:tryptophan synthase beta chain